MSIGELPVSHQVPAETQPQKTNLDHLQHITVRIATKDAKGEDFCGTGFFFHHKFNDSAAVITLVTNRHVVEGMTSGNCFVTVKNTDGSPHIGDINTVHIGEFNKQWTYHPNPEVDVAAMLCPPAAFEKLFVKCLTADNIPSVNEIANMSIFEEIYFIGYPSGLFDRVNYTPILRRGITATKYSQDYDGKPCFVIDASVFQGSSGSPVFIYESGRIHSEGGGIRFSGQKFRFLGIIASQFYRDEKGAIAVEPAPTNLIPVPIVRQSIDLGLVFKAPTVLETVKHLLKTKHGIG